MILYAPLFRGPGYTHEYLEASLRILDGGFSSVTASGFVLFFPSGGRGDAPDGFYAPHPLSGREIDIKGAEYLCLWQIR